MKYRSNPWLKIHASDDTVADTTFAATTAIQTSLPANAFSVQGATAVRFRFYGGNDNNDTGTAHLYAFDWKDGYTASEQSRLLDATPAYFVTQVATIAITLGQATGTSNTLVPATNLLADTIAVTDTGGLAYERLFGYSSGGVSDQWSTTDGWAELIVVNPGFQWMHVQFNTFTSWDRINGLYSLVFDDIR